MTELTPRDIQTRIRHGESPAELVEREGLDPDRVDRFAAPVLAEREHLAALALASSVRRRGETAGHRQLRATVAERLLRRGLDADEMDWDAYRMADGRWAVTASFTADDVETRAGFLFDPRGRFSVAADDDGRRLIGDEQRAGRPRTAEDEEPTVDLTDELALVRAVQAAGTREAEAEPGLVGVEEIEVVAVTVERSEHVSLERSEHVSLERSEHVHPERDEPSSPQTGTVERSDTVTVEHDTVEPGGEPEPAEHAALAPDDHEPPAPAAGDSELGTLYAMLGSDGYSEDSPRVYAGLSDASAVPVAGGGGWEPPIVVDVPVEPSPAEEAALAPGEAPDRSQVPMDDKSAVELSSPLDPGPADPGTLPGTDEPAPPYARTDEADRAEEAEEFQLESDPPPARTPKRRRASVPSWDEIMFGGPKPR